MHLSRKHGYTVAEIPQVDAIVPWKGDLAAATGNATAKLAAAFEKLKTDVVLVVGDRVEGLRRGDGRGICPAGSLPTSTAVIGRQEQVDDAYPRTRSPRRPVHFRHTCLGRPHRQAR